MTERESLTQDGAREAQGPGQDTDPVTGQPEPPPQPSPSTEPAPNSDAPTPERQPDLSMPDQDSSRRRLAILSTMLNRPILTMKNSHRLSQFCSAAAQIGSGGPSEVPRPEPGGPVSPRRWFVSKRPPTAAEDATRQKRMRQESVPELFSSDWRGSGPKT